MKRTGPIVNDGYTPVVYHQFSRSLPLRAAMRVAGILSWPLVLPLALVSRASDFVFRTVAEALAGVPYLLGIIARSEFYRFALERCGDNVTVGYATYLTYRGISVGSHVTIGSFVTVHHCDIGSYVMIADGCRLLSGSRYHSFNRTDLPMALQGGSLRRISIGDDCWIGANAVLMADVAQGSVVGAAAVVTRPVTAYSVVAGNPARLVRSRLE